MLSPRWLKLLGDARAARGRLLLLTAALAISVAALTTMLGAYAVLRREVPANYLATNPASAQLVMGRVDESIADAARRLPGIADAEVSSAVRARVVTGDGEVRPLLLFVVPALERSRINSVRLTSGGWPTSGDSIVLERTAVGVAKAGIGQTLAIDIPNRGRRTVRIVGTVHDPSLAPAWQEQTVYGYVTPEAVAGLGEDADLHILKLIVSRRNAESNEIDGTARGVASWLRDAGHTVQEIRVPPPRTHPHQSQMMTLLVMLLCFSGLGLVLGSVLGATIVGGLLAEQSRDIAVMKAIGARAAQIATLYLVGVGAVALAAVVLGSLLGLAAARAWVNASAQLLNLEIASHAIPMWALALNLVIGIAVPLAATAVPVAAACRRTVREAMQDRGISREAVAAGWPDRALGRVRLLGSGVTVGLRNAFRRRGRLGLTVLLLAAAGGVFISSGNLRIAWYDNVAASAAHRHYDLEVSLQRPAPEEAIRRALGAVPGIQTIESWPASAVSLDSGDHVDLSRTYPDEGHGRIALRAVPPASVVLGVDMIAGRWLEAGDHDAMVVNSTARAIAFPRAAVGDIVALLVRHQPRRLRIVGMAREVLTPGTIYTTGDAFRGTDFPAAATNVIRLALTSRDQTEVAAKAVTTALEREGIAVRGIITEKLIRAAQTGHIRILVYALGFIALTMGLVGALGLASMLSASVTDRTREFGVLRAIGARRADVWRVVTSEAMVGAVLGAALAIPAGMPVSSIVGQIVARVSGQPLEIGASLMPVVAWFTIAIVGAIAAAFYPSLRAARLTVRETLASH